MTDTKALFLTATGAECLAAVHKMATLAESGEPGYAVSG